VSDAAAAAVALSCPLMANSPILQQCRWHPVADLAAVQAAVVARVLAAAEKAIGQRGGFRIVLAGGDTPRGAYEMLCESAADWPAWHVYFGDERCTPRGDPLRNSRMAELAWLNHVAIPAQQVHEMPGELGPRQAATRYAGLLESVGEFDLVLLGLGEDGHTGSLFPGHDLGLGPSAPSVLAVFEAPKPPPDRVTMSARRFSQAAEVIFLVAGEGKRDAVRRWRADESIPARAITPASGVDVFVEAALLADAPA
jgi:6-phosphogluconolactonase